MSKASVNSFLTGNISLTSPRDFLLCCFGSNSNSQDREPIKLDGDELDSMTDDYSDYAQNSESIPGLDKNGPSQINGDDSEDSEDDVKENFEALKNRDNSSHETYRKRSIVSITDEVGSRKHSEITDMDVNYGDRLSLQDFHSQTSSIDAQHFEAEIIGVIQVKIRLVPKKTQLIVRIVQLMDVPGLKTGSVSDILTGSKSVEDDPDKIIAYQVHLTLMPLKKQRYKSKIRALPDLNFNEDFTFSKVLQENVNDMFLRLRLYGSKRGKLQAPLGQCTVPLSHLQLTDKDSEYNLNVEKGLSEGLSLSGDLDAQSVTSMGMDGSNTTGNQQEVLLGLSYNSTTGRMAVEVVKATGLKQANSNKPPDAYIKLSLITSSGLELAHSKTSIRRASTAPVFKETFMFQVALFQLNEVTLMVTVFHKKAVKRKDVIGWFSLGNKSTGEEEDSHWEEMKQTKGEQVSRWHILLRSTIQ